MLRFLLFLISLSVFAKSSCDGFFPPDYLKNWLDRGTIDEVLYKDAKKLQSPKELEKLYAENKVSNLGEPEINFKTIEHARAYSLNHPSFLEHGFSVIGKGNGWEEYICTMNSSTFKDYQVGWQKKLTDGSYARYRLDWDPTKFGHINIEYTVPNGMGKMKTTKLSVGFLCNDVPCSEEEVLNLVKKLND